MDEKNQVQCCNNKKQIEIPIHFHVKQVLHKLIWLKSESKICQLNKNKTQQQNSFKTIWRTEQIIGPKIKDANIF